MTAVPQESSAPDSWAIRRMRVAMLKTLPDLENALCRSGKFDPDMWHPARANRRQELEAMRVCMACPEMLRCLGYAVRSHPISGVWGATTEAQRKVLVAGVSRRDAETN